VGEGEGEGDFIVMIDDADCESEVERRAAGFDLIPLIDLLFSMGYRPEDLVFESNFNQTSRPNLIERVAFVKEPIRHVVITVNFGLLDPKSPLPSYFTKLLEVGNIDDEAFLAFLRFFDHLILRNYFNAVYPERDRTIYKSWENTKRCYLSLLGLRSPATIHWLFQSVFPELGVEVGRGTIGRDLRVQQVTLGESRLGAAALGARSTVAVTAAEVTLYCEEESTPQGTPWADEIRKRLAAVIFPVLADGGLDLKLSLVIWSQRGWAQLKPGSYLGFDRIRGGEAKRRTVLIHRGQVPQPDVATPLLPGRSARRAEAPAG
jgi:hypothetical protein